MSLPYDKFEVGNTKQFTLTLSASPVSTPWIAITFGGSSTLVASVLGQASDTLHWYAFFTVVSQGYHAWKWTAPYSPGNVKFPEPNGRLFKGVVTEP